MAQTAKDNHLFFFDEEATGPILEASELMYKAVGITYGPKGRNVLIEKPYGRPVVTRDGATVAREVYLSQREVNAPLQMVNEASQTTNRVAGDGTTATVMLTHNLIKNGQNKVGSGIDPMEVRKQIMEDSYVLLDELANLSKPVTKGQLNQVATVSSGDENLGKLISEAVEKVGPDGGILTEKAPIAGVDREYVDGYYLQQGFTMIEAGKKTVDNPYIIVSARTLTSWTDAMEIIQKVATLAHEEQDIPLEQPLAQPLKIAFFGEIEGDAYTTIIANIQKGVFDGVVVKTPPMGDMGVQYLEDVALYVGGKAITNGENLTNVDMSYIGKAEKVTCTTYDTVIFGGEHASEDMDKRLAEIKERLDIEEVDPIAEKLRDRIAKLENKIARFRIGGATDTEKEELEFRIEDAIQATRAAAMNGVVAGGGVTLVRLSQVKGISDLFVKSLQDTFKKLISNAGLPPDVKLNELLDAKPNYGFNLRKGDQLVDLVKEGILDPTLVLEQVIKNAASNAGNALTIGLIITAEDAEEK